VRLFWHNGHGLRRYIPEHLWAVATFLGVTATGGRWNEAGIAMACALEIRAMPEAA
jgi:hypothetical protein